MKRSNYVIYASLLAISAFGFGFKLQSASPNKFGLALGVCMMIIGATGCTQVAYNSGLVNARNAPSANPWKVSPADASLLMPAILAPAAIWAGFSAPVDFVPLVILVVLAATAGAAHMITRFTKGATP